MDDQKEILEKIDAQVKYCKRTGSPHFAPGNGVCYSCHRQIYTKIVLPKAMNDLITGCPYCHYSFCE